MRLVCLMIGVIFGIVFGAATASAAEWRRFVIPSTGLAPRSQYLSSRMKLNCPKAGSDVVSTQPTVEQT